MMGPSHALSGASVWLAGSWALDHFAGYAQSPLAVAVGTTVCAGGALFPDLDLSGKVTRNQGGATVARTFGVFSLFVAEVVEKVSLGVYTATKLSKDPRRNNGHRTFTHTLPFAGLVGWGTTTLAATYGKWAVVAIVFLMAGLALRGLFDRWAERAGWLIVTLASGVIAWFTAANLPGDRGYPMLGFAAGVGCVVHLFGDMITKNGVPILWPIPIGRRMWRMVGVPNRMAVKVGGRGETLGLRLLFTTVAVLAVLGMFAPRVLSDLDLEKWAGG
ncbi:metal-dependent hydrolase [Pseudosporangium ferrugineum]|uniref:LexA-binding, inner membrane-associated putative hydrolase n=1 Tax=Pseudosporangium ferrugineum TaxID=439699 RepID=A0A2T0RL72_9ACTN|nr:metal-dependent hydrolase [Pseudosporangium ferrugineum]PRY21945.1 LexA-binding, inner membrane-associated putative hydrolase [Pseudosporangium ferrugineum]